MKPFDSSRNSFLSRLLRLHIELLRLNGKLFTGKRYAHTYSHTHTHPPTQSATICLCVFDGLWLLWSRTKNRFKYSKYLCLTRAQFMHDKEQTIGLCVWTNERANDVNVERPLGMWATLGFSVFRFVCLFFFSLSLSHSVLYIRFGFTSVRLVKAIRKCDVICMLLSIKLLLLLT